MAETSEARGTFRRSGPSVATLEIEYEIDGLSLRLPGGELEEGVTAICQAEIDLMRSSLGELGEALASQLSDEGGRPAVERSWSDRDNRTWEYTGDALHVDPSRTRMRDTLRGYEGASDAELVREHVRQMIEQRESSIRLVYAQVLAGARAGRGEAQVGEA